MKNFLCIFFIFISFFVFACSMTNKKENEARAKLSEKGYSEQKINDTINALNDFRISLATSGMNIDEIEELTDKFLIMPDPFSVIVGTKNAVSDIQKKSRGGGFKLTFVNVNEKKNGIVTVTLREETETSSKISQISQPMRGAVQVTYEHLSNVTYKQNVRLKKSRIRKLYIIDENFVPFKNTTSITANGLPIRYIPSKLVKSDGVGSVIIKDNLIGDVEK